MNDISAKTSQANRRVENDSASLLIKRLSHLFLLLVLLTLFSSFDGLSYRQQTMPGKVVAHILEVDPSLWEIFPAHAYDQAIGRQTVGEIAEEHQAIAGVNGGFFKAKPFKGLPAGILKIKSEWFGWPTKPRGAVGWSNDGQRVYFDRILCEGFCAVEGNSFKIDGLNRPPSTNEMVIFTPAYSRTTLTNGDGFEVIIRQNEVLFVKQGGNSFIPLDGYVLAFGSKDQLSFWKQLPPCAKAQINLEVLPQEHPHQANDWNHLPNIVGGTPLLVDDEIALTDFSSEKTLTSFIDLPHVRTAVGVRPNGQWIFVVVEGNGFLYNFGMSIPKLAQFMAALGCKHALNLDGGGSSTMVFNGRVVNNPIGDIDESLGVRVIRQVSDAILIKEKRRN